ncbi:MAG: hypothetical protein RMJ98_05475 [Myxococcales bacterium]|nr:hypothetical protein [Polyangiaceae bacterium]MDW8248741.1 hypothetical protein [Myxococcales bacterium]
MPTNDLLHRLLLACGASYLAACGGRADLPALSYQAVPEDNENPGGAGGQAGAGGTSGAGGAGQGGAALCDASQKIPRDDQGSFVCESKIGSTYFFCEVRCYVPSPSTLPGACRPPDDLELSKLPGFENQTCGFQGTTTGPFCGEDAEQLAGNIPACCYLGPSEPCIGRPLLVLGRLRFAPLRVVLWG